MTAELDIGDLVRVVSSYARVSEVIGCAGTIIRITSVDLTGENLIYRIRFDARTASGHTTMGFTRDELELLSAVDRLGRLS